MRDGDCLRAVLDDHTPIVVALSGGTDSSVLAAFAKRAGMKVTAVSVDTGLNPAGELENAQKITQKFGISFQVIRMDALAIRDVRMNSGRRCYACKRAMMSEILNWASDRQIAWVADGTNADDRPEGRPGIAALQELGIISPFAICGMGKAEIKSLAGELGVPILPSSSCLATRFPPDKRLDPAEVDRVRRAEALLRDKGVSGRLRVRIQDGTAVIVADLSQHPLIKECMQQVTALGIAVRAIACPDEEEGAE
jgi:uncharacterized protein